MRHDRLAFLGLFTLLVANSSLAVELTKQARAKHLKLDQPVAESSQKGSAPTVQVDDVVLYQQDFNGGAAGWTTKSVQDGGGGVFWHAASFEGDGVMECSTENSCFVASPGYGNDWVQDITKTFSVPQVVSTLIGTVDALVAGGALPNGPAMGLNAKLNAALAALAQGNTALAVTKLQDFINKVNGLVNANMISAANAALLTGPAQSMIALLTSPPATMTLDFLLQYEIEIDFDFVFVQASSDGGATFETLAVFNGSSAGSFEAGSVDVTSLAGSPPNLVVRFRFTSDGSISDEDGGLLSGGAACRLDDLALTGFGTDGFETGNSGWTASSPPPLDAEFRLETDPPTDFAAVPPAFLSGQTWVAYDPATHELPFSEPGAILDIAIESPVISIPVAAAYFLEVDVYSDQAPFAQTGVAINWDVASGDDPCLVFQHSSNFNTTVNGTIRRRFDITNFVPPGATSVVLRLRAVDFFALTGNPNPPSRHGRGPYFDNVTLLAQGVAAKADARTVPLAFALGQNQPNPFNPTTTIHFTLPMASEYTLAVFDVTGRLVRQYTGSAQPGEVVVTWDGTDAAGGRVSSGLYFYRVQTGKLAAMKRMVLLK